MHTNKFLKNIVEMPVGRYNLKISRTETRMCIVCEAMPSVRSSLRSNLINRVFLISNRIPEDQNTHIVQKSSVRTT